ncbi:MAG: MmcQ/YjbR family DNA-binding protein [Gemmatimonadaceae bacterium]
MPPSPIARLRKVCLALPDAHEVEAWGEPTFRVNNKLFAMFARGGTHHAEVDSVWIKATAINQGFIIASNPKRYFSPPYVGPSGWVGAKLEGRVSWTEIADLLRDGYDLALVKKKRVNAGKGMGKKERGQGQLKKRELGNRLRK